MLKTASLMVMLVAAPAFAQEQGGAARTDLATIKKLLAQAASTLRKEAPADLALGVAQVNLSGEVAAALHARPAAGLKVAPR